MLLKFKLHGVKKSQGSLHKCITITCFSIGMHKKTLSAFRLLLLQNKHFWHLLGNRGRICSCAAMNSHEISAGLIYIEKEILTQLVSLVKWKRSVLKDEEGKGHD